jgi:hypothetical protein
MRLVTCNPQKDGRIVLGTAVHLCADCRTLKRRDVIDIQGSSVLVQKFPKCNWCFDRKAAEGRE